MAPLKTVCYPFVGDSVGGAHISALLLIEQVRSMGLEPLILLHQDGPLARHLDERGFTFERLPLGEFAGARPGLASIAADMKRVFQPLHAFLKSRRVDILHCNDLRMNLSWLLPARAAGVPLVWHQRTFPNSTSPVWKLVPRLAAETIAISRAVAEQMRLPLSHVVYNPFHTPDAGLSRAEARAHVANEFSIPDGALLLGFVGRLVNYKRPDLCIDVISRLSRRDSRPVHLILIGRGTDAEVEALRDRSRDLGVGGQVHFAGFRFPIEPVLKGIDVLIAPSETEGFGRALVESMLAGTPVVASSIAAHREIIESDTIGRIAPAGDAGAFADGIADITASSQKLSAMGAAGQASAEARFSCRAHTLRMQQIYARLAS